MRARRGGEDVVVLREPVVGGENDELGATPKRPAEEVEGVECVGEVGKESNHHPVLDDLLDAEHRWRSPREVCWKYALEAIIKWLLLYFLVHDNCLLFML